MERAPYPQTYRMEHILVIYRPSVLASCPISFLFRAPNAPTCSQDLAYSPSAMCILEKSLRSLKKPSSTRKYKTYLYLDDPYRQDSASKKSGSSLWWFGGRREVIPTHSGSV